MTRQISSEFKRECAKLVLNYGYAHKDAAKTMNVSISSIQRWVTQYKKERQVITPKSSVLTPEQKRSKALLEKQVKQLQSDNQLLKKAAITERFLRSLKSERIKYRDYVTKEQAIANIIDYIEPVYNQKKSSKVMGVSRDTFYRYKELVDDPTEQSVIRYAIDYPAYGQHRTSNELRKQGIFISGSGVRSVWLRHNLENFKKSLSYEKRR